MDSIETTYTTSHPEYWPDQFEPAFGMPRSGHWPALRDAIIAEQPWCSVCRRSTDLIVHHLMPFHLKPELELDKKNLFVLCETPDFNCHFVLAHFRNWEHYNKNILNVAKYLREQFGSIVPKPSYPK